MPKLRRTPGDQKIRDRIVSDFECNFLVEAGAGSGKTYSLAMRMAAGIECGAYRVEGMAAVTFTRKAAAELRGRFQEALEERLRTAGGEEERGRLLNALEGIERLFAGTIHAFCAHLLRERPVDAKVAPGFEELGDVDDLRLRKQAWRDFVAERRPAGWQPLLGLLEAGVRPKDLDASFATVCNHEDVEFDMGSGEAPDPAPVWREIDRLLKKLKTLRPPDFHEKTTCPVQRRFEEYEAWLRVARRDRLASLASFLKAWGTPTVTQKYWGEEVGFDKARGKEVKTLVDAFNAGVVEPFMETWRAYVHRLAMAVLKEARDYYADLRRRQNVVNYVDLLGVTARMLRECAHVRRALQAKYRWLFIDEFQDTDPIQAEIFLMLAAKDDTGQGAGLIVAQGTPPLDPFSLPLRRGSLFVVGDPKQSIFRFRRADIDIYSRVAARIEQTGGARLSLTANFRSLPGVCALANAVFPPLFGAMAYPWSPPFEKLDPVRDESEGPDGPRIGRFTLPEAPKGTEPSQVEAEAIASYIRSEVASKRRGYGDFLVLTRFKPRLGLYAQAFDALEIPVEVSGGGLFCKSPEVEALALLLAALADPLDSVSLVGVLRGPLFGISDPELFQFCQAGGRLELNVPLPEAEGEGAAALLDKRFGPALSAMRRLQVVLGLTRTLPLGAAVDRMLEETGWLALASTGPSGAGAGRLLQAIDRVREVVEEGGGLADAAGALDEEEVSNEAEALPLEPGRRDVVQLMNLHKAKGLEAPVVILADATHDFDFPLTVRVVRTGARASGYLRVAFKRENGFGSVVVGQPRDWAAHEEAEQKYIEAERLRLLYVAGTRAQDLLIVCRSAKPTANKCWREFSAFLASVPEIAALPTKGTPKKAKRDLSPRARVAAEAERGKAHARARAASWAVTSVTGDGAASSKAHRSGAVPAPGTDLAPAPGAADGGSELETHGLMAGSESGTPGRRADAGTAWGSLIHGLLEHAVRHADATRPDLERLARWLTVETPELRPLIPDALDLVDGVRDAPFWTEVRTAAEVHVEVPFAVRLAVGKALGSGEEAVAPTVLRGVIDLAYRAHDGWCVLDYKTDRLPTYEAAADGVVFERHGAQLAQYCVAWERVSGSKVERDGIVLVRGGRTAWRRR